MSTPKIKNCTETQFLKHSSSVTSLESSGADRKIIFSSLGARAYSPSLLKLCAPSQRLLHQADVRVSVEYSIPAPPCTLTSVLMQMKQHILTASTGQVASPMDGDWVSFQRRKDAGRPGNIHVSFTRPKNKSENMQ